MQEYKIIKQVLLDYVDEETIFYEEEENCFYFLFGVLGEYDEVWSISFDLTLLPTSREMLIACNLIIDLMNRQIMCQMDSSFYSIFTSDGVCKDLLWDSDIYKEMQESKENYEVVKERLTKKILDVISEEVKPDISNAH